MDIRTVDDVTVAVMGPRLDASTAGEASSILNGLVREGARKIVCDFSLTEFMSSAGLRLLLSLAKKLKDSGGELLLCSLCPFVRGVMEMGGILRYFRIFDSEGEALKGFR